MRVQEVRVPVHDSTSGLLNERTRREHVTWVFIHETRDKKISEDVAMLRRALAHAPEAKEFRLTFSALRTEGDEITLFTRPILEIHVELSAEVEVPPQHVHEGRVRALTTQPHASSSPYPVARIRVSTERPEDEFSAVFYRNHWF